MIELFHGTDDAGLAGIIAAGAIRGPVFLTPRRDMAEEYAPNVVAVRVDEDSLMIDADLPGQNLLTVQEANDHFGNDGWSIRDYLRAGQSVAVSHDVVIA
ncbi:hypothetical protein RAN3_2562 [plant metagenome]|uniref:Uncharacterized protein n=1 Tax=plant metagenome TaxID=1297885 RepID=A0A484U5S8_9ZZZZ